MVKQKKVTKSDKIRQLWDEGMNIADIARVLNIRYQFAYNVITYYVAQKEAEAKRYVAATDHDVRLHSDHQAGE